jgi:DNA-binding transcriptional MerR regulator
MTLVSFCGAVGRQIGLAAMRSVPSALAAQMTGMSLRQLRYLAQVGLVVPSARRAGGRGETSLYTAGDLRRLLVVERLRAACGQEIRVERLQRALAALSRASEAERFLVMDAEACWVQGLPLDGVLAQAQALVVVDLRSLDDQLTLMLRRAGMAAA